MGGINPPMTPLAAHVTPLRSLAQLLRVSNAPTVLSNVMTGWSLGVALHPPGSIDWSFLAYLGVAFLCLYHGGMVLNDAMDASIDARERPARPIPAGDIPRPAAFCLAAGLLIVGAAMLAFTTPRAALCALILLFLIIAYNALHRFHIMSVALMAACRAMIYITAAVSVSGDLRWPPVITMAVALALYIAGLSIVARREASSQRHGTSYFLAMLLPASVIWPALAARPPQWPGAFIVGLAMTAWILACGSNLQRNPPRIKSAVEGWLAGICLIDAWFLSLLSQPVLGAAAMVMLLATRGLHRRISGT